MRKLWPHLLFFSLVLTTADGWSQSTYTPWQTIYEEGTNEGDFRVQVSFKLTQKDCKTSPVSYYRTSVSKNRPKAYLKFSFKYRGCDGSIGTETPTIELNSAGVREGGGMVFAGKQLEGGVYAVKMNDYSSKEKPRSNSGSNEIAFPGPSAASNAKGQQEVTLRKKQEPQSQPEDHRQSEQKRQVVSDYDRAVTQGKSTQDAINTVGDAAQNFIQQRYEQKKAEQQEQDRKEEEREQRRARKEEAQERLAEAKRERNRQTITRAENFVKPLQKPSGTWPTNITSVYYFAYAVNSQAVIVSAKPVVVYRNSDGSWPFLIDSERLFKEESSRRGYAVSNVVLSGYYSAYQEAEESHTAFVQQLGADADLGLVTIVAGQQGSINTKVSSTANFWDDGKVAPTEKPKPSPEPKKKPATATKSFWDN